MSDPLDDIPPQRREAARAALALVTSGHEVTRLTLLKGGVSGALIYRVDAREQSFVLRLEPERVALQHRQRGFACMLAAAAKRVAPHVYFADPFTGIVVMEFIDAKPISAHPGGQLGLASGLGALISRVQTTELFPTMFGEGDIIAAALEILAATGFVAAGRLDHHRDALARIRAALPWDPSLLVSTHHDPNPRNLLFDGERLWLVDWELASRNDRLFDLAVATIELADTPDLEAALLCAAFGSAPDAALYARLRVTRQLARLFYGCMSLEAVAAERPERQVSLDDALTPTQFLTLARQRRLPPSEINYAFGKMSLAAFVDGCSAPDFADSLALAKQA